MTMNVYCENFYSVRLYKCFQPPNFKNGKYRLVKVCRKKSLFLHLIQKIIINKSTEHLELNRRGGYLCGSLMVTAMVVSRKLIGSLFYCHWYSLVFSVLISCNLSFTVVVS